MEFRCRISTRPAEEYGISENATGVVVTEVNEDSLCAAAGVRVGD